MLSRISCIDEDRTKLTAYFRDLKLAVDNVVADFENPFKLVQKRADLCPLRFGILGRWFRRPQQFDFLTEHFPIWLSAAPLQERDNRGFGIDERIEQIASCHVPFAGVRADRGFGLHGFRLAC